MRLEILTDAIRAKCPVEQRAAPENANVTHEIRPRWAATVQSVFTLGHHSRPPSVEAQIKLNALRRTCIEVVNGQIKDAARLGYKTHQRASLIIGGHPARQVFGPRRDASAGADERGFDGLKCSPWGAVRGRQDDLAVTRWRDIGDGRRTLMVYAQSP